MHGRSCGRARGHSGLSGRMPGPPLPASLRTRSPARARQLPLRATPTTCPQTAPAARRHVTTTNGLLPAALVPPAWSGEGARELLGQAASYHDGPRGPHASSCPGLGAQVLMVS